MNQSIEDILSPGYKEQQGGKHLNQQIQFYIIYTSFIIQYLATNVGILSDFPSTIN